MSYQAIPVGYSQMPPQSPSPYPEPNNYPAPQINYAQYSNVEQVHHRGVHQPDANTLYVSTGCCFKIFPIIFLIFGLGLSPACLYADNVIGAIAGTVVGVLFIAISIIMMFIGYYSVYFYLGDNTLTVTKKALCGRKVTLFGPGQLVSIELKHDITYTGRDNLNNYQLDIISVGGATDTVFRVGQNSPLFTYEEIGYFNYVINTHIQTRMRI